jgi:hypothetical protein
MADNLPPSSADVTESGSLNLPRTLTLPLPIKGKGKVIPLQAYIGLEGE